MSQHQRLALLANRHAKPSGKRWYDPAERAWVAVNRRPFTFVTFRSAYRHEARAFR